MKSQGYGEVVGTRTAGAGVAGRAFILSDDSLLLFAVADVLVVAGRDRPNSDHPCADAVGILRRSGSSARACAGDARTLGQVLTPGRLVRRHGLLLSPRPELQWPLRRCPAHQPDPAAFAPAKAAVHYGNLAARVG